MFETIFDAEELGVWGGVILVTDTVIWTIFQETSINQGRKHLTWNLV